MTYTEFLRELDKKTVGYQMDAAYTAAFRRSNHLEPLVSRYEWPETELDPPRDLWEEHPDIPIYEFTR